MHHTILIFALIGALGVGAQWLAWRLRLPAIVLMLAAGILAGPVFGWLDPEHEFGAMLSPIISVAVAVILFEGGLSLNLSALRDASQALKRLMLFAGPLAWLFAAMAAHYIVGLSWPVAAVFGGILVVTGPTVVTPLLRQAKLAPRTASVLHWEAIVNDPVGALFAVLAFEFATAATHGDSLAGAGGMLFIGIAFAALLGLVVGWLTARAYNRGLVPEYMKAPAMFALVLVVYAGADMLLAESGLLAVTVMGLVLGNSGLRAITELRRFKESVTVLLVSGVFILLASTLNAEMLARLDWRAAVFVLVVMLVTRPLAVWLALIGADLPNREKFFIGWMAPRGVVAVAVSGFFGQKLMDMGYADGAALAPIAFAIVAATVIIHGFSVEKIAAALGLKSTEPPGVLIAGASPWSIALANALTEMKIPVLITDQDWRRLRPARQAKIPVYYGEILSEAAEHHLDLNRFDIIIAATDNDAYNALICTEFAPEFGRLNVFQLGRSAADEQDPRALPATLGGRTLFSKGASFDDLNALAQKGWVFTRTRMTEEFGLENYLTTRAEGAQLLANVKPGGKLAFSTVSGRPKAAPGDTLLSFAPEKAAPEAGEQSVNQKEAAT